MPSGIRIEGAQQIALVAKAVRSVGADRTVVKAMIKEIKAGVKPVITSIRSHAESDLPHRGGLNTWVAKARITTSVRRSMSNAGVKIKGAKKGHDLQSIDRGRVRHKSWGHAPWSSQSVKPGFFTEGPSDEAMDALEQAVGEAADAAARKILYGW